MPVILKTKIDESIVSVAEMHDGQIGVIVGWTYGDLNYIGRVVQKCGDLLVSIGMPYTNSFTDCNKYSSSCKVRLLKKGEILEIEQ